MNADDAVLPWSSPRILRSIESSSEFRTGLLSLASCNSNVASRAILCPLFSLRSLQQLSFSPALGTLSSMCNHALAQQQRYEAEVDSVDSPAEGSMNVGVADEVTFSAVVTSSFLDESTVNLGVALLPLIGCSHGHLFSTLKKRLLLVAQCSSGTEKKKDVTPSNVRKTITLLPEKTAAEKRTRRTIFCRHDVFPEAMASTTNVVSALGTSDRREFLRRLGDAPLPFQVRSREELMREQLDQKAFEASVTTVLTEPVGFLPPWKRRKIDIDETIMTESIPDPETTVPAISPLNPPRPPCNATWVKNGELVLVNGRLVHREAKKPPEGTVKKEKGTMLNSEKEKENTTTSLNSTGCSKKKINTDCAQRSMVSREDRETSEVTTKITASSRQNVPSKTRDELAAIVNDLDISDKLREALLIGLNFDECTLGATRI